MEKRAKRVAQTAGVKTTTEVILALLVVGSMGEQRLSRIGLIAGGVGVVAGLATTGALRLQLAHAVEEFGKLVDAGGAGATLTNASLGTGFGRKFSLSLSFF